MRGREYPRGQRRTDPHDKEDANRIEESWKETTRIYNAEHREARRHAWCSYYRRLSESFRRRSEECAEKARAIQGAGDA
jgi:hypothetical protein